MHIPKKELEIHSSIDFPIQFLQKKHSDYKVYNSSDVRSLGFLSNHIERLKDSEQRKIIHDYQPNLENMYLITLKHKRTIEDPSFSALLFLVDLNKNYIKRLKEDVVLVEDKLIMLVNYFKKSFLEIKNLENTTPQDLHRALHTGFSLLKNAYPNHSVTDILSFDKRDQNTGYFILFRLKDNQNQAMRHCVYELCHNNRFQWDAEYNNFADYYKQYKDYFKDVASGKRL